LTFISNTVAIDPSKARCEMPVKVVFEDVAKDVALPKFTPR
jgi:hypothetical protein